MARFELLKAGGGSYLAGGDALLAEDAPVAKTLLDSAAAADILQITAAATLTDRAQGNDTPPPADLRARTDLIYGTEIGAWLNDGEPAVTVAPAPARHARMPVVRFALHDTFTDLLDPNGNPGQITRADFRNVIDAIVNDFHAIPWLKCLPIAKGLIGTKNGSIWCPPWTGTIPVVWLNTYKAMLDEVAKVYRGPIIIESNNEMEYACWETWRDRDGASLTGAGNNGVSTRIGQHYIQTMAELRRYARDTNGFAQVVVGGYIGVSGGPQWGATITVDGSKPYGYGFSGLGSQWLNEFSTTVKAAYDTEPAGTKADLVPDFLAMHAYPHGGDFATGATSYEFTGLTGYDAARPDDIAYSYYRQWLTNARTQLVATWGATIGNAILLSISEWSAGLSRSDATWSGWTTTDRPEQFFAGWLTMLQGDGTTTGAGTRYWEASNFLLASESDAGASRYYNTVKQDGSVQTWYYTFRDVAAADPATAYGVGLTVLAAVPVADQALAAELLDLGVTQKTLTDSGQGSDSLAAAAQVPLPDSAAATDTVQGILTVVGALLTAGASAAPASSYQTASISPAASTGLLVFVEHGGIATLPTLSGLGATWTRQGDVAYSGGTRVLTAHTAPLGGAPGSGQLTISGGAMTHAVWSVIQLTDADLSGVVVGSPASGTATDNDLEVALAAAAAPGNRPFAGFAAVSSTPNQVTPRAGWVELSETVV